MHPTAIKRTTATALAALAVTGAVCVPAAGARVPTADPGELTTSARQLAHLALPSAAAQLDMHASTAVAAAEARPGQDLRSGDARDAAQGRGTFSAPDVTVVRLAEPVSPPSGSAFDWSDAGIGAGGALIMIVLATGSAFAVGRRRGSVKTAATV